MAKYNILFPTGIAGMPDDLLRRISSLPAVYDGAAGTVEVPDGPNQPTAEYINAIFSEYAGTANLVDEEHRTGKAARSEELDA